MKHTRAFSLVELIVVITILAILGTIGFISLQGYSANARDSVRISDLRNIEKSLELYHLGNGSYPSASTGSVISYSGSELWTQGTFDDSLTLKVGKIHPKPTDPLTGAEYVYSVTHSKQEYQIAGALERGNPVGLLSETYADYNQAVISGKYNGSILGKTIGSDLYIFGVPSIVALTETDIEIQDIIAQDKFVLNKYSAIPKGLETAEIASNRTVSFTPSTHTDGILFKGSSESLASQSGSLELAQSLYDYYQGSSIADSNAIVSFTQSDPSITANEVQASNSVNYLLDSISLIEAASIQVVAQIPTTPTSQQIIRRDYSSAMNSSNGFYNSKTIPNFYAFAALKSDGSISVWGDSSYGGSGAPTGIGYTDIYSNQRAFAALKSDGSISVWGDSSRGGSGAPTGIGYTDIYSTYRAFAALKSDGSISVWGDSSYGGSGAPTGTGYTDIYSTGYAFAALKSDGSISVWGDSSRGGSGAPTGTGFVVINGGMR